MAIIVGVALDMFLEQGFVSTRMDDIANRCRISKRTLYRLFPSKLDLFRGAVERHRHSMLTFPEGLDHLPLQEALAAIFQVDLEPEQDGRRARFIAMVLSDARSVPELAEIMHSEGGAKAREQLATWLERRKARENIRIRDAQSAASILLDMVFGAPALKPASGPIWPGAADRSGYLRECISYFVNGVR